MFWMPFSGYSLHSHTYQHRYHAHAGVILEMLPLSSCYNLYPCNAGVVLVLPSFFFVAAIQLPASQAHCCHYPNTKAVTHVWLLPALPSCCHQSFTTNIPDLPLSYKHYHCLSNTVVIQLPHLLSLWCNCCRCTTITTLMLQHYAYTNITWISRISRRKGSS